MQHMTATLPVWVCMLKHCWLSTVHDVAGVDEALTCAASQQSLSAIQHYLVRVLHSAKGCVVNHITSLVPLSSQHLSAAAVESSLSQVGDRSTWSVTEAVLSCITQRRKNCTGVYLVSH